MARVSASSLSLAVLLASPLFAQDNWPQFRGAFARGVADGHSTPTEWSVADDKNIVWNVAVPGMAHSAPIVWGDRVFVTTATKEGEAELKVGLYGSIAPVEDDSEHEFVLMCFDRETGKERWRRTSWKGVPAVKRHPKGSHAACTPATDGERVIAFFGTEGLYAYDMDGKELWKKDFGLLDSGFFMVPDAQWGFASSPVLHEGRVYLQCDVNGQSFTACLDAKSGDEIWRTDREEVPTWSTPTVDPERGRLVLNGYKHIGGYDLETGKELWKLAGGGDIPVPTPIVQDGLIYITNAHGRMAPIAAIPADAEGELKFDADAEAAPAWFHRRGGNYMQTPIVYDGFVYCCRDNGVVGCYDAKTGEPVYRERLGGGGTGFTASGVVADGKLYFVSEIGEIYVVKPGKEFEILAVNELGETCMAAPAVSQGTIFFRTKSRLIAVGSD